MLLFFLFDNTQISILRGPRIVRTAAYVVCLLIILSINLRVVLILSATSLVILTIPLAVLRLIKCDKVSTFPREELIKVIGKDLRIEVGIGLSQPPEWISRLRFSVDIINGGQWSVSVEFIPCVARADRLGASAPGIIFKLVAKIDHALGPARAHISEQIIEPVVQVQVLVPLHVIHDLLEHVLPQLLVHALIHLVDEGLIVELDIITKVALQAAQLDEFEDHQDQREDEGLKKGDAELCVKLQA